MISLDRFEKVLGHGADRGLTLKELCAITDLTDRKVRLMVGILQKNGVPVINLQDGNGYYISDDFCEIEKYIAQETSRGIKNLSRASALKRYLKENGVEPSGMVTEGLLI